MRCFVLLLIGLGFSGFSAAQELSVKRVDIFKNGTAFFTSEGTIKLANGEGRITPIPQSAFGTLWLGTNDKLTVTGLYATQEKAVEKRAARNYYEALKANIGKKVAVYGSEKTDPVIGVIESVGGSSDSWIATVKAGAQTIVINPNWYAARLEFPDGFNRFEDTTFQRALKIRTTGGGAEAKFQMVYFQTELGWTPSYRVDLLDDKSAQIVLSATIVNDVQDLDRANVNLVVGYPHFKFANVLSPLTSSISLQEFQRQLNGESSVPRYYQTNIMAAQSASYEREALGNFDAASYGRFTAVEGQAEEDLFFYSLPDLSLKKNERAQVTIFSAKVPYQHIYEAQLDNAFNIQDGYLSSGRTSEKKEPTPVWHSIKLDNESPNPWTTASALTLQNGRALGQDILRYTPVKSRSNLKITQSPDIHITDDEKETARKEDVKRKDGYTYDLVTISGEIVIHNYKD